MKTTQHITFPALQLAAAAFLFFSLTVHAAPTPVEPLARALAAGKQWYCADNNVFIIDNAKCTSATEAAQAFVVEGDVGGTIDNKVPNYGQFIDATQKEALAAAGFTGF